MATHKLGKLKINTSGDGLAFRFGDGEIHRLRFGKKRAEAESSYDEDYLEPDGYAPEDYDEGDYAPENYSGRFSRPSNEPDYVGDYADDGYDAPDYGDDYADDGYDDRYDDGRYEDDRYDDGGDYGDDDRYYDGDGEYDDRYLDEDADEYGDAAYADENPVLRYIDENDWVTYLLLFILPPLGIYLLWRRGRFDRPIRIAVSAVSAIWFIIAVVWLVSAIFTGVGDVTSNPPLTMVTTATPTVAVEVTPTPDPSADAFAAASPDASAGVSATRDPLALDATATPIAGANPVGGNSGNLIGTADTVITTATGIYYHSNNNCPNIEAGASLSTVTREVALNQGKAPCPLCYPNQKIYYATANGKYYHVKQDCSDMIGATAITKEAAEEAGKTACPACIQGAVQSVSNSGLRFVTSSTKDRSGITVWATPGGKYYHTNATCSGMSGATSGSLLQALLAGKTACPTCCASSGRQVYATENGKYYHSKSDCSGMVRAYTLTVGEALVMGKKSCPTCLGSSSGSPSSSSDISSDGSGVYVYGTPNGKYYHTNATCSGMSNASRYTLKSMLVSKRAACPVCCSGADTVVYASRGGTYYHSYATCSGMQNAEAGTLASALAYGYKKCPKCWGSGSDSSSGGTATGNNGSGTTEGSGSGSTDASGSSSGSGSNYVYCTVTSKHYHTNPTCSGMTNASRVTVAQALSANKTACSTCASSASRTVYSNRGGKYFHATSSCDGQSGMPSRSLEEALALGQRACPTCRERYKNGTLNKKEDEGDKNNMVSSGKFKTGTSGIKVYATASGRYFHTQSSHAGEDASRVTLETALNYGKTGCPTCASSANTRVYAAKGGKYYHYSKTCAGSGATSGTRAEALAYGFDPCPYCVTKTETVEVKDTYKAGTSGIKVWASISGKYYHTDSTCAGSSASRITLETALNYGKRPCPSCASSAGKTVYSSGSDKYYHSSRTCAGDDAASGDLAKALALGKRECPICIGGSESYEESDIKYSAPGDTPVYVDLDSDLLYYHKDSRCNDAGLSGGTKVSLEFVLTMKYRACPFCAPPTSVE